MEEIKRAFNAREEDCYFWAVPQQAELDLLIIKDGLRLGFEVKYTDSPTATASMKASLRALKLASLTVVCPGNAEYKIDDQNHVCALESIDALPEHFLN